MNLLLEFLPHAIMYTGKLLIIVLSKDTLSRKCDHVSYHRTQKLYCLIIYHIEVKPISYIERIIWAMSYASIAGAFKINVKLAVVRAIHTR